MEKERPFNISHYFLFASILLVFFFCFQIVRPYLHPILLATILAALFRSLHIRILHRVGERKNLAAGLSCLVLSLAVVLPLLLLMLALIRQGIDSFNAISDWIEAGKFQTITAHPLVQKGIGLLSTHLPDIQKVFPHVDPANFKMDQALLQVTSVLGKSLLSHGSHFFGNITALTGKFFLMLFTFFFMVRDEETIFRVVLHLIPLSSSQEEKIIFKIKSVSRSALLGTLVTALAQGVAGGIAFWISGLPALFWGMVMAFASLVPLVGTALVWVPAAAYLFVSGSWGYGIFMVLWCVIVVGMLDNLVRPLFMQGGADMSTLLIFFSILGGINYFGLIGLLYGPLLFGLAMVLLYIYELEFQSFLNRQDAG